MTNAQHEDIDIKYLNLVDESMDSQIDQCLYSKTDGPDSILVEDLPHWARHHASNGIEQLLRLPQKLINKRDNEKIPSPFSSETFVSGTKAQRSDCILVKSKYLNHHQVTIRSVRMIGRIIAF